MNNIKSFDDFVNEGMFDFLKSDVVDFTKEEEPKRSRKEKLLNILKSDTVDFTKEEPKKKEKGKLNRTKPVPQRPYFGVQEEEEEERPYKKIIRKSDYLDDYNKKREAEKEKINTLLSRYPKNFRK